MNTLIHHPARHVEDIFAVNGNPLPHPAGTSIPHLPAVSTVCSSGESINLQYSTFFVAYDQLLQTACSCQSCAVTTVLRHSGPEPVYWGWAYVLCWRAALLPHCHARGNSFTPHVPFSLNDTETGWRLNRVPDVAAGHQHTVVRLAVMLTGFRNSSVPLYGNGYLVTEIIEF